MVWTRDGFADVLRRLRRDGHDSTEVEVKRAAGGTPRVAETLSSFGNMPEGGAIIFGLDESNRFAATGLADPAALEQGVAAQARNAVEPPVAVHFERMLVDAHTVVIADVVPVPAAHRPCRVKATGLAYSRFSDGDYRLSEAEIQQLLAQRERHRYDADPVPETTPDDLDPDLKAAFLASVRSSSRRLADASDDDVLRAKRVLEPGDRRLTVAGLYALGRYPQQFAPNLSITAVAHSEEPGVRNADRRDFDGPLPDLLDDAVAWVARNTRTRVRFGDDGHGFDEAELPPVAVRELVANALVHRDLGPNTMSKDVQLHLTGDRLVIVNPGGLWGITSAQLGSAGAKSAVNEFLYEICKHARTGRGHRIIEGEGGGLREVRAGLEQSGLPAPEFHDNGVRFTAIVSRWLAPSGVRRTEAMARASVPEVRVVAPAGASEVRDLAEISKNAPQLWEALADGPLTAKTLAAVTGLTSPQVSWALNAMLTAGVVQRDGGQGHRKTTYRREG